MLKSLIERVFIAILKEQFQSGEALIVADYIFEAHLIEKLANCETVSLE